MSVDLATNAAGPSAEAPAPRSEEAVRRRRDSEGRTPPVVITVAAASGAAATRLTALFWSYGTGFAVSLVVHAAVLVTLAFVVYTVQSRTGVGTFAQFSEPADNSVLDSKFEIDVGREPPPMSFDQALPPEVDTSQLLANSDRALNALVGTKDGEADGEEGAAGMGALGNNLRVPDSAVTKGSFTVWTEPLDPLPGRPYDIIIQVKLPPNVTSYRLRDLSGMVRGTDGYRKYLKFKSTDRKAVTDGAVQVKIPIPGASQLVKDTIEIQSTLLKEQQKIEIVF